jgi:hypothetical protein
MQDSSLIFTYSGDGHHNQFLSASQRKATLSKQVVDYEQLTAYNTTTNFCPHRNARQHSAHKIAPRFRSRQRRDCGRPCCVQLPLPRRDCGRYSAATAEDCALFNCHCPTLCLSSAAFVATPCSVLIGRAKGKSGSNY